MEVVSLLIKPSSSLCNLACHYCFYLDEANSRGTKSYGLMNEATLEALIKEAYATATKAVVFAFQGGEPTLVGLPFYERFIALQRQYNTKNLATSFSIQTNGILLNDDWCRFFKSHQFLVGISLDGSKRLHNAYRKGKHIKDTHTLVMHAIQRLKKHHVDFNILCVVNDKNSRYPDEVYDFFVKNKLQYLQFIPCIDDFAHSPSSPSLTPDNFLFFLNRVFKRWCRDLVQGRKLSIRYFDNLIGILLGYLPQSCDLAESCSYNLVIEANGNIYPCDFYVLDHFLLGNIHTTDLASVYTNPLVLDFIKDSFDVTSECRTCVFYQLCKGGCRRYRETTFNTLGLHKFCFTYQQFLSKNIHQLEALAHAIKTK